MNKMAITFSITILSSKLRVEGDRWVSKLESSKAPDAGTELSEKRRPCPPWVARELGRKPFKDLRLLELNFRH